MGVIGRLVIHIPDVTPITSLCLFAPTFFSKKISFLIMMLILLLSDFCLHLLFQYPTFGSWTVFTYSGWFAVVWFGFLFANNPTAFRGFYFTCTASFIFWLWTNLGTFFTTHLYIHNLNGFLQCYIAALPFLRNSVMGSIAWSSLLMIFIFYHKNRIKVQAVGFS